MTDRPDRAPFPPWLRELCYYAGIIVALTIFGQNMKSDQRSTSEKLDRVVADVSGFSSRLSAIENRLPNREADQERWKNLEQKVEKNHADLQISIMKLEKWKEDTTTHLIKKGIIE